MAERRKILTKELQKIGGNWGHPRPDGKHIRIDKLDDLERPNIRRPKKRRKKSERPSLNSCPFCLSEFNTGEIRWWMIDEKDRVTECKNCGATIGKCPCCKRDTWISRDGKCKHHSRHCFLGCGYIGSYDTDVKKI